MAGAQPGPGFAREVFGKGTGTFSLKPEKEPVPFPADAKSSAAEA